MNVHAKAFILGALCAFLVLLLSLWPAMKFDFFLIDDRAFIDAVPRSPSMAADVKAILQTDKSVFLPLTGLTYYIDARLAGSHDNPRFRMTARLSNIFFAALAAGLCALFVVQATQSLPAALAAALFFALHPLHLFPVFWIAARKDILVGLLLLATVYCYRRENWLWALGFWILAFFSKISAYGLLGWIYIYELLHVDRRSRIDKRNTLLRYTAAIFTVAILVPWLTHQSSFVRSTTWVFPQSLGLLAGYTLKVFWPYPLTFFFQDPEPIGTLRAALFWGLLVGLGAWLLWNARRLRRLDGDLRLSQALELAALALALIGPFIFIVPIHLFFYGAYAFGFVAPFAIALGVAVHALTPAHYRKMMACTLCLCLLGFIPLHRTAARGFGDSLEIFKKDTHVYPNNLAAHWRLGQIASTLGNAPLSMAAYQQAQDLFVKRYRKISIPIFEDHLRDALLAKDLHALQNLAQLAARNNQPFYCNRLDQALRTAGMENEISLRACAERFSKSRSVQSQAP